VLLEEYRCYLLAERDVQAEVARGYLDLVRPFVAHHAAAGAAELGRLSAADVKGFLTAESRRLVPKTAWRPATALRSLLRLWHLQGLTSGPLDRAVPKAANAGPGFPGRWSRRRCRPCLLPATAGPRLAAVIWRS
jgi:integrase/recombinase XerD